MRLPQAGKDAGASGGIHARASISGNSVLGVDAMRSVTARLIPILWDF